MQFVKKNILRTYLIIRSVFYDTTTFVWISNTVNNAFGTMRKGPGAKLAVNDTLNIKSIGRYPSSCYLM